MKTTPQDCSLTIGREANYGTAVVPSRSLEFTSEALDVRKGTKQGTGLRPGAKLARASRRYEPTRDAGGDTTFEVSSRGFGIIYEAMLGKGISTLTATAGLYQQVFTIDTLASYTLQKGIPALNNTTGEFDLEAYTLPGAMCTDWELGIANADVMTLKTTWDARDLVTDVAFAPLAYPTSSHLLTFNRACLYTGDLTRPTDTELATAATPLANVVSATVQSAAGYKTDRYTGCGQGRKSKPLPNDLRTVSGNVEVEHTSGSLWVEALMDDAPLSLLVEYHTLEDPDEVLQIVLPYIRVDGELPKGTGNLIQTSMSWTALDDEVSAEPIWLVCRTHDTAL